MISPVRAARHVKPGYPRWLFAALVLLASQQSLADDLSREACAAISGQRIGNVRIVASEWLTVDSPARQSVCVVTGHRPPYLDIELVMPEAWSGRYLQQGGGGFDGRIRSGVERDAEGRVTGFNEVVRRYGAVYASSNGGNRAEVEGEAAPGVWLAQSAAAEQSLTDYAYLSLKTTLDFALDLSESLYGRLPDYSYFKGCSNGGRNAYIVAQRWPGHFDGIVSGCEPMNMPGTFTAWLSLARGLGTPAELSPAQYSWAYAEAVAACDSQDGAADGILANPAVCDFSPRALACTVQESEHCLSAEKVATLELLLTDIVDSAGNVLSSRFYWADFGRLAPQFGGLGGVYGWIATGDAAWFEPEQWHAFSPDQHHYVIGNGLMRAGLAHDRIAIAQYVADGNKLISWHAGADDLLSPGDHVRYFGEMMDTAAMLASGSGIDVSDNARFYIVPGANHGAGVHPSVGWVEAIIDWVEWGTEPGDRTYTMADGSAIPVCRYPAYARGTGAGYRCEMPQ